MADEENEGQSGDFYKSLERAQMLREQETQRLEQLAVEQQRREIEARRQQEEQVRAQKDG